jgi:ferredoxin-NADP reductase
MPIIKKYPARVVIIVNPVEGIYTLEFESLGKPFKYEPGQFLHLALDEYDPAGQWPDSRCFSMQSSPDEAMVRITYAVKGRFTTRMQNELKLGSLVTLKLPYGDLFIKPHNKINTVFIAGGTGITPFLSLFNHPSFLEYVNPQIYLGFRNKFYNIYEIKPNFMKLCDPKILYQDIDGYLDIQKIFSDNGLNSDYFISGPPLMIKEFKSFLLHNGLPADKVLTDDWD